MGCIYIAINNINDKKYVGWTVDLEQRKWAHRDDSIKRAVTVFHKAIAKYGWGSFRWEILFEHESFEVLKEVEIFYIRVLNTQIPHGYNMTAGGDGFGGKHKEETKKKISQNSGSRRPEVRAKIALAHKGRKLTEEHKQKLSRTRKERGLRPSKEAIQKSVDRRKGIPMNEITKERIKAGHRNKTTPYINSTTEGRARLSKSMKGIPKSEEHKRKLREVNLGKKNGPCSEDTKRKLRKAALKDWAKRKSLLTNSVLFSTNEDR